ncbi:hypothetical protein [Herbaspirillum robiniae]|uniref:hypothetical protein n=1 Tax=Herbaspirillum robiniae TaxID=2014887 RepID=UPI0011E4D1BC|nr:hypothetical protein [Herbaspirillum robiniae]
MSEKLEVRGDVAQLIGGNVNEAPRQNNVVNFNVGGDKGPVQTLTDLQRKRIAGLVRELCAITQEDTLDVYRVILTEFGAERMKDMPREKYHDVVAQVERWIAENKQGAHKTSPAALRVAASEPEQPIAETAHHCDTCSEKDRSYSRLQRVSRGQWMLSGTLAIVCGLLLYKMPTSADAATSPGQHCFFQGSPYTAGSTIKSPGGVLRECVYDETHETMMWEKQR